jgi:hypothetical protein
MVDRGDHDAAILNYMFGMHLMNRRNFTNLEALPDQILTKDYCIASMNETLIYDIDAALSILSRDGSLERLHRKWFAQYDPKLMSRAKLVKRLVITLLLGFVMILIIFAWVLLLKRRSSTRPLIWKKNIAKQKSCRKLKEEYNVFLKGPVIVIKISSPYPTSFSLLKMSLNTDGIGNKALTSMISCKDSSMKQTELNSLPIC